MVVKAAMEVEVEVEVEVSPVVAMAVAAVAPLGICKYMVGIVLALRPSRFPLKAVSFHPPVRRT
jgi:hypothetical protein